MTTFTTVDDDNVTKIANVLQECSGLLQEFEQDDDDIFVRIRECLEILGFYDGERSEESEDQSYG